MQDLTIRLLSNMLSYLFLAVFSILFFMIRPIKYVNSLTIFEVEFSICGIWWTNRLSVKLALLNLDYFSDSGFHLIDSRITLSYSWSLLWNICSSEMSFLVFYMEIVNFSVLKLFQSIYWLKWLQSSLLRRNNFWVIHVYLVNSVVYISPNILLKCIKLITH